MSYAYQCGRRPKSDNFDASVPFPTEEENEEIEEEEEEVDEEVDFDRPLSRGTKSGRIMPKIWTSISDSKVLFEKCDCRCRFGSAGSWLFS